MNAVDAALVFTGLILVAGVKSQRPWHAVFAAVLAFMLVKQNPLDMVPADDLWTVVACYILVFWFFWVMLRIGWK